MKSIFKKTAFNQGLTLIETLTVVSILVILSSIIFGNYKTGSDSLALDRAAQKLAQDLRRVNEMALSGTSIGTNNYRSFGIYFNKTSGSNTSYIIYGNLSGNTVNAYQSGTDTLIETVTIEKGIKICNVLDNGAAPVGTNYVSASFLPPMPNVYIDEIGSGHEASIVLAPSTDNCASPTKSKTVKVNAVGRVDITN